MSTTPRKNRSEQERRTRAKALGLRRSATWAEVEFAATEFEKYVRLAERYGLDQNATWDDIYLAFRKKVDERRAAFLAIRAGLIGCSPFLLLMLVWFNWLTIGVATVVFLTVFILMFWGYGQQNSEHILHMLAYREIKERCQRDGVFGV